MGITNQEYFLLFVLTYLLVGALTPLMRKIAIATDVVDRPNAMHKSHKQPVPYLGGVAIILGVVIISYSASLFSNYTSATFWLASSVLGPALFLGLIGLWDDVKNLNPLPRFISTGDKIRITVDGTTLTKTINSISGNTITLGSNTGITNTTNLVIDTSNPRNYGKQNSPAIVYQIIPSFSDVEYRIMKT